MSTPTPTVAYLRVSTAKQAEEGLSIEAQEAKVRLYARLHNLHIVAVDVDRGISAKTMQRPGLQAALGRLRSGEAGALLVVKLDRLTRSVRDLLRMVEDEMQGARLISVNEQVDTTTPGGRLVLTVLGAVAQWEREAISDRTRAVMDHKRAQGEWTGGKPPYGYRVVPAKKNRRGRVIEPARLQDDPVEQEVIEVVRDLVSDGDCSLPEIAAALNERGYPTRTKKPWSRQAVHRIVRRLESE